MDGEQTFIKVNTGSTTAVIHYLYVIPQIYIAQLIIYILISNLYALFSAVIQIMQSLNEAFKGCSFINYQGYLYNVSLYVSAPESSSKGLVRYLSWLLWLCVATQERKAVGKRSLSNLLGL